MAYRYAIESPFRMQWDSDSRLPLPDPGSAPNNCGPSCVANIAGYYRDTRYGIYLTRRLAVSEWWRPTSITEQKVMLEKRGVPCIFARLSLASIKSHIRSGQRPVMLALDMSKVPINVAGHPFRGRHSVVALENATYSGMSGMLIRDPNFSTRTNRLDPTGGKRFYADWIIQAAFVNVNGWALVPTVAKVVSLPDTSLPAAEVDPMLKKKFQPWKANAGGTPIYQTPNGKLIRVIPAGIHLTSSGETQDGVWRSVLAEVSGAEMWVYAKRSTMTPLPPPPATRTSSGDPAFDKAVTDHVLSRIA